MTPPEIKKLFEEGKLEEAKKQLEEYLKNVELSPEEQGEVYFELANLYLKINTALLTRYEDFLKDVVEDLRTLKAEEEKFTK